jgi:hypothetical protein
MFGFYEKDYKIFLFSRVSGTDWTLWPARGGRWPAARYQLVRGPPFTSINQSIKAKI